MKSCVLAVMIGATAIGCKPQQNITKITQPPAVEPEQVKDAIPTAPKYYLTLENDTLYSLGEEVEIEMSKVYKDTISIIGVGDIMMGTNFPEPKYLPGNDGTPASPSVRRNSSRRSRHWL